MPLTDEQAKSIKEQLFKQVENFPEDKRAQIKEYIASMNNEQLEEFLKQNQQAQQTQQQGGEDQGEETSAEEASTDGKPKEPQCVMCLISSKKIESLVLYEDKDYLSALEINPISKGHAILVPKKHIKESKSLKSKIFTIANRIGRHIVKKLGAENFQINSSDDLHHAIVNIIPRYKGEKPSFERKPANKQELQDLAMKIGKIEQKKKIEKIKTDKGESKSESKTSKQEKSKSPNQQFSRRIP